MAGGVTAHARGLHAPAQAVRSGHGSHLAELPKIQLAGEHHLRLVRHIIFQFTISQFKILQFK
jgi:hypothetical protein